MKLKRSKEWWISRAQSEADMPVSAGVPYNEQVINVPSDWNNATFEIISVKKDHRMTHIWEYETRLTNNSDRDIVLKWMGEQGWELVSTSNDGWSLFFKRPKQKTY